MLSFCCTPLPFRIIISVLKLGEQIIPYALIQPILVSYFFHKVCLRFIDELDSFHAKRTTNYLLCTTSETEGKVATVPRRQFCCGSLLLVLVSEFR